MLAFGNCYEQTLHPRIQVTSVMTLGGYVYEKETGGRYGITNAHVCGAQYMRAVDSSSLLLDEDRILMHQNSHEDHQSIVDDVRRQ
jgi:hypothetical protein